MSAQASKREGEPRVVAAGERLLPTSLAHLDAALHGGLPSGSVTELVGASGVGKTQFCMSLAARAVFTCEGPARGAVAYIDTENKFSATRLGEIARHQYPAKMAGTGGGALADVHVFPVSNSTELLERCDALEEFIIERSVRLVVLDSIAAVARKDFDRSRLWARQELLSRIASSLK